MRGRILVVDDDADVLEVFELLLKRKYDVTTLADAGSLLRDEKPAEDYDLAILDHRIGQVTSHELIPLLKSRPAWAATQFILHSGIADLKAVAAASQADGYLPKPSSIDEIQARVAEIFRGRE